MITTIVLTRNEEQNILRCLNSLSWCDEVIVIDDNSSDATVSLAEKNGVKVRKRSLDNFSSQRNYGLEIAKNNWVLFIDADEIVSENLKNEILEKINTSLDVVGFYIKRFDHLWGKKINYGDGKDMSFLRLAKKDAGFWKGVVHEIWDVKGKTKILNTPIEHYPHPTVKDFLSEINNYSTLRSRELFNAGRHTNMLMIILYTKGKFLDNYILKLGILDGTRGLIRALMMSYYSFLTKSKLYFLWQNKRKS